MDTEEVYCPACGPAPYKIWMDRGDLTRYLKCSVCGTIFASPRPTQKARYHWLKETFTMDNFTQELIEHRRPALALEAARILRYKTRGNMLDIGCSSGLFFEFFDDLAWKKHGVELSPSTAEYAANTTHADVRPGTIQSAHFPNAFFDLITMIDMFYYDDDPEGTLREVLRTICPDGLLAIELPGQAFHRLRGKGPISWLIDHHWTRFSSRSGYLYWYTPAGIEKLLNRIGFKVIDWTVINSPRRDGLTNRISQGYFSLIKKLVNRLPHLITWAPKYLIIAAPAASAR